MIKAHKSSCKVAVIFFLQILLKPELSGHIFEEYLNVKSHENPSIWSRIVPCVRTDRNDEASCRFLLFCELA